MSDLQKLHAERIRAERAVMDETGMSRQQARAQLSAGKQIQEFQATLRQVDGLRQLVQPPPFKIEVTSSETPAAPLPAMAAEGKSETGGGGTGGDAEPGTPLADIIVVLNGTAYYTNIYTDGRLEAV